MTSTGFNFTLTYISTEFKKHVILFALLVNMMLFTAEIRSGKLLNASNFLKTFSKFNIRLIF